MEGFDWLEAYHLIIENQELRDRLAAVLADNQRLRDLVADMLGSRSFGGERGGDFIATSQLTTFAIEREEEIDDGQESAGGKDKASEFQDRMRTVAV